MEEEKNWNMASNSQLKEECERLEKDFSEKQELLREGMEKIEELNNYLIELSREYNEVKKILNKREGRTDG